MKQPTTEQVAQWDSEWVKLTDPLPTPSNYFLYIAQQAYAAGAASHDCRQMRDMLHSMQSGEISVSRGVELLEMWLAGNYTPDQLPPAQNILPDDRMPWDEIDLLRTQLAEAHEVIRLQVENYDELKEQSDAQHGYFSSVVTERDALQAQVGHLDEGWKEPIDLTNQVLEERDALQSQLADAQEPVNQTLLDALKTAQWMLERDHIDNQKMRAIEKCEAAIAAAEGVKE